jgi:hypothetical protein
MTLVIKQSNVYLHQFPMVTTGGAPATGVHGSLSVFLGKNGAAGVANSGGSANTAEVDATNLKGVYSIMLQMTDTNIQGTLSLVATATGCSQYTEIIQVQPQIFSDVAMNAAGRIAVQTNLQQNVAAIFPFTLTIQGQPAPGLANTLTIQRALGTGGFAPIANPAPGSVTDLGGGSYTVSLAGSDLNAATVTLLITSTSADTAFYNIITNP